MDFVYHYTDEQEQFREEVRTWLEIHLPKDLVEPIDPRDQTHDLNVRWQQVHKEIAKQGWMYPTWPTEYGGGGR